MNDDKPDTNKDENREKKKEEAIKKAVQLIAEGEKKRIRFTLKDSKVDIKTESKEANPDKISFGKLWNYGSRLEFCTYRGNEDLVFIYLNDEFIILDQFKWRKLFSILAKLGHHFGILRGGNKRE